MEALPQTPNNVGRAAGPPAAKRQRADSDDAGDSEEVAALRRAAAVARAASPGVGPPPPIPLPLHVLPPPPSMADLMDPARLLPSKPLAFSVLLTNPELIRTMVTAVQPVLPEKLRLWWTSCAAFRGVAIDSMNVTAMAVTQLACPVVLYRGDNGRVPEQLPVTVATSGFLAALRGIKKYQQLTIYQELASHELVISVLNSTGQCSRRYVRTIFDPTDHHQVDNLVYGHELHLPFNKLKDTVTALNDIRATELVLEMRRINGQLRVLYMRSEGALDRVEEELPMLLVAAGPGETTGGSAGAGAAGGSSSSSGAGTQQEVSSWLSTLRGQEVCKFADCLVADAGPGTAASGPKVPPTPAGKGSGGGGAPPAPPACSAMLSLMPVTSEEIDALPVLTKGSFCVPKLHGMLKNIKDDDAQLKLYFSSDMPLILKFVLDEACVASSFIAFLLGQAVEVGADGEAQQ